jgi:hypothetical protein
MRAEIDLYSVPGVRALVGIHATRFLCCLKPLERLSSRDEGAMPSGLRWLAFSSSGGSVRRVRRGPSRPTMFCCDQIWASSRRALPVAVPLASLAGLAPVS